MTSVKTALLIIGMHRSGTSVLSRLCNLMGASLGSNLIPAAEDNQKGFWENQDIVNIHEELLKEMHSGWEDFLPLPDDWQNSEAAEIAKGKIAGLIQKEFSDSEIFAVKDPRVSILLPLWNEVLDALKIKPVYIFSYRNPVEVAASLGKRNQLSKEQSLLSWLHYNLSAELDSRGKPRLFISFAELFQDWRRIASNTEKLMERTWPKKPDEISKEVAEFISPDLKHHNLNAETEPNSVIEGWCAKLFKAMESGQEIEKTFDEIRAKFYTLLSPAKIRLDKLSAIIISLSNGLQKKEEMLAESYEANAKLQQEINAHLAMIRDLDNKRHDLAVRLDELALKCQHLERNVELLEDEVKMRTNQLATTAATSEALQKNLDEVLASSSWKITKPIRDIKVVFNKKVWK